MFVFFNWRGILYMVVGFVVILSIQRVTENSFEGISLSWIASGAVITLIDLVYRYKINKFRDYATLLKPKSGGHFMFVPGWLWGLLLVAFGVFRFF